MNNQSKVTDAQLVEAAIRDADEISERIHKGGYRGNLFDTETLRNHVRKLAAALQSKKDR